MNLAYLVPRVFRHFLPDRMARFLLLRSLIIRPGLETSDAAAAVGRYSAVLASRHATIRGKRVLVFGYGGRFDVGVAFLEAGAAHVVLCDKYAQPDDRHNSSLLETHGKYLHQESGRPRPRSECMTIMQADIREASVPSELPPCELVVSSSVYEHLEDVDGVTRALERVTTRDGWQIHFVDLRDHFFKYPFEMLHYSEAVWRGWLNPGSNHNRFRIWDYRHVFEKHFKSVEIEILGQDDSAFKRARKRIRPEYISGNPAEDAATLIRVVAAQPRR